MADRGTDTKLGEWLDNQDVCQMLNISPRTLQTLRDNGTLAFSQINRKVYYKPEDVERILYVVAGRDKDSKMYNLKTECL
jgi:DNA-binding transcriptional MerR regulator